METIYQTLGKSIAHINRIDAAKVKIRNHIDQKLIHSPDFNGATVVVRRGEMTYVNAQGHQHYMASELLAYIHRIIETE